MGSRHLVHVIVAGLVSAGCSAKAPDKAPVIVDIRHDDTHCHVHDRPLLEDLQPAAWEHRQMLFWPERDKLFPFARDDIFMPYPEHVEFARVMYCPACRRAKAEWLQAEEKRSPAHPAPSDH